MYYRALRNKHQRNEFLPTFRSHGRRAARYGESVQNWAKREERERGDIYFLLRGSSFPAEVISPGVCDAARNRVCEISGPQKTGAPRLAHCSHLVSPRLVWPRPGRGRARTSFPASFIAIIIFAPLLRGENHWDARFIYVYNCERARPRRVALPLKI